jgi:hypothetical protein
VDRYRPVSSGSGWRAPAWLVGACVAFWWLRVWQTGGERLQVFANFDALMYWIPLLREAAAQWRTGGVPLWNPYQGLGAPLLATQQVAAGYPLNVLYVFLETGPAWLLTGLIHHCIAAIGMYAFCRTLALSPAAALIGGVTYAFSAIVIGTYANLPDEFICLAWLPAMFACAEVALTRPTMAATVALAGVWALHILGGDADTVARAAQLLACYVAVRLLPRVVQRSPEVWAAMAATAAAAVLALALTAFQWMPTLELLRHSVRDVGRLSAAQQSGFAADPRLLFTSRVRGVPTLSLGSSIPLILALIGLWTWPRRSVAWFCGGAAIMLVMLSAGPATPLFALFRHLPTGTWFRVPQRILNLWPVCIAPLTAAGAEVLLVRAAPDASRRRGRVALASAGAVLAVKGVVIWNDPLRVWLVSAVVDLMPLALIAILVRTLQRDTLPTARRAAPVIVALLIGAAPTALYQPDSFSPHRAAELYAPQAALFAALREEMPARVLSLLPVADGRMWAKLGTYFEVQVLNDFEPLSLADFETFADKLRGAGGPTMSLEAALDVFTGEVDPPRPRFDDRLLNLSGVRFIVAGAQTERSLAEWFGTGTALVPWRRSATAVVYENRTALARAFFARGDQARASGASCGTMLSGSDFDPATQLLLDSAPVPSAGTPDSRAATVRIIQYAPGRVRLSVTADQSGYVVLTDAFYPGWQAKVDAVAVPILRGDCFFRAVAVSAGTHEVTFLYAPGVFKSGAAISAVSLGLVAAILLSRRSGRASVPTIRCLTPTVTL